MTTDLDPRTRVVLSWLREDLHEDAERVLLRALDEVDTTPQRRSLWTAWRTNSMTRNLMLAASAVAVLVVAVVGWQLLPKAGAAPGVGGQPTTSATAAPTPAPTSTPAPTPIATPVASPSGPPAMTRGPLDAGTYVTRPNPAEAISWQLTVPEGWTGGASWYLHPTAVGGPEGPDGVAVAFLHDPAVFVDDCNFAGGMTKTGTVAELVAAIRAKDGWTVSKPEDVTIGGFSGQRLDVQLPADAARCGAGSEAMVFGEPGTQNGFFQQGPSQQLRVWILDVDGQTVGLVRESFEASPADRVAEAEAIVESSVVTP